MQTPPSDQNNAYQKRGFTQVPQQSAPPAGMPHYAQPQPPFQQPVQQAYPPQQDPYQPQAQPYQQPLQQDPYQPQSVPNEYQQQAYQPQQPAPFAQQSQAPYQAPPQRNYGKLNLILGIVVALLVVVLSVFAVTQLSGGPQAHTAIVTAGEQGSTYMGDALIVRNEVLYTQTGVEQIEYIAEEGSFVRRGEDSICLVYTSGFNTREWTKLNDYRSQIKEYQKTLLASTNIEADSQLKRYNTTVLDRAKETQQLIQNKSGNLVNQEQILSTTIEDRSYYLKQKYTEDQKLSRLYDDEKTQLQRIETWTKPYTAVDPGIVSFYTDGYERALTLGNMSDYSPTEIRNMYRGSLPSTASLGRNEVPVYRLVRDGTYAVLMLCDDTSWTPTVGASYVLMIENFDNTRVSATVESVTRSEGELLVRLSVSASVSPVLYIRSCHVQLSESIYTLTVPVNALTTSDGDIGVIVVQPDGQYFLPVTVVTQDAQLAHIVPNIGGILTQGSTVLVF